MYQIIQVLLSSHVMSMAASLQGECKTVKRPDPPCLRVTWESNALLKSSVSFEENSTVELADWKI